MQPDQDPHHAWPTTQVTLLRRVADQSDKKSWECFVHTYGPLIRRYCLRRGLQEADALDVEQDVLLQVSKSIGGFYYDPQRGRFRNWLGTLTHRAMMKNLNKSRRSGVGAGRSTNAEPLSTQRCTESFDEVWVESFNAHIYREAAKRLRLHFSEETWRAFEATFTEDRPPENVASELGRTVSWVYQAKSQVVRQLKEEILYLAEDAALLNLDSSG